MAGWGRKCGLLFLEGSVRGLAGPDPFASVRGYGIPMFVMHYSYLGLDPHAVPLPN
jgi:hypothetical protein